MPNEIKPLQKNISSVFKIQVLQNEWDSSFAKAAKQETQNPSFVLKSQRLRAKVGFFSHYLIAIKLMTSLAFDAINTENV